MPNSIVRYDLSDVDTALAGFLGEVITQEEKVGKEAVDYAVENGDYRDCSGNLRAQNRYRADISGLELMNMAEYASEVEARGHDVIGGAALFAERRLKEIFGK